MRTLVVWCPDWPLVAAGLDQVPAAVMRGNRVVACSAPAREEGVRLRQRRREAEAACSGLVLTKEDPVRDLRAFDPVVAAIGELTPLVELTRPGVCSLPVRGPARYFGGESRLVAELSRAVGRVRDVTCRIGVADTPFAARLAARQDLVVPTGSTAAWLAGLPVRLLGPPDLVEILERLGIERIGDFAALDEGTVGARFDREGVRVHRLSRATDEEALVLTDPPLDLTVSRELEAPVEQVETVAFIASALAEDLVSRLAPRGLACTKVLVEAATEHAEELSRWWRSDGPFTSRAIVDRVRWQLEGWLSAGVGAPTAGISLVRLTAGEIVPEEGRQLGIFGEPAEVRQRVERHAARIQGLLGHEAVVTPVMVGGRGVGERVGFVPFGEPREEPACAGHPWPGRLPSPAPSMVHGSPLPVAVVSEEGAPVGVSGRGLFDCEPAAVVSGGSARSIVGWAGPWPAEERWWDLHAARRRARLQVEMDDGSAHVLVLEHGSWAIEATYD